ncbi:MAG: lysogenization regulator HflD [Gammaproteobacteria bacterium]|nr:lysogenization regulator HflD [Gammaproteobacteria bacterium]
MKGKQRQRVFTQQSKPGAWGLNLMQVMMAFSESMLAWWSGDIACCRQAVQMRSISPNGLRREPRVVARLGEALETLHAPNSAAGEPAYEQISAIYQSTLSTLSRRIQVRGVPALLAQDSVAAKVRTLLLAAVRAAWLWRQLGGRGGTSYSPVLTCAACSLPPKHN